MYLSILSSWRNQCLRSSFLEVFFVDIFQQNRVMEATTVPSDDDDAKLSTFAVKKICRCCLSTERRMKNAVEVQEYFMELAGINVSYFHCY